MKCGVMGRICNFGLLISMPSYRYMETIDTISVGALGARLILFYLGMIALSIILMLNVSIKKTD